MDLFDEDVIPETPPGTLCFCGSCIGNFECVITDEKLGEYREQKIIARCLVLYAPRVGLSDEIVQMIYHEVCNLYSVDLEAKKCQRMLLLIGFGSRVIFKDRPVSYLLGQHLRLNQLDFFENQKFRKYAPDLEVEYRGNNRCRYYGTVDIKFKKGPDFPYVLREHQRKSWKMHKCPEF